MIRYDKIWDRLLNRGDMVGNNHKSSKYTLIIGY